MSSAPPAASEPPRPRFLARYGLSARALLLIAIAFSVGLLLFLLLWLDQRNDEDFFRAGPRPADQRGEPFEPLPMPDAAGGGVAPAAAGRDEVATETPATRGEIVDESTPPPEAQVAEAPDAATPAPSAGADSSARPLRSPPPRYPARALQRGESGTVLLQVEVDPRGRPQRVNVVQSSRSRSLDREAVRAVERWEFSPAIRNGRAVSAKVLVPIEFNP